jgi:hypothetical protein
MIDKSDVWVLAIQNSDTSSTDAATTNSGNSTTATASSVTTTVANDFLICAFSTAGVLESMTPDGALTDLGTIGTLLINLDVAYKPNQAQGATGSHTAALGGSTQWGAITLAVKALVPAPVPYPQPSQVLISLSDYWQEWSNYKQSPYAQWFIPPAPPTRQPSQDQTPLPVLDSWWEQFKLQPIPVSYVPGQPEIHQLSQVIVTLPDHWQEWSNYKQSPYAQWFIPPKPPTQQSSQRWDDLSVLTSWWEQFTHWPIPQGMLPTPPPTHQTTQRWDDLPNLNYQHYEQLRLQPLPSGIFTSQEGGYKVAVLIINSSQVGAYRVQNQIEGWLLYLGLNGPPDLTQPPAAFSASLPFSVNLTPPPIGTLWTYYAVVRRQDLYGLQSQNQFTISTITIDSTGGLYEPPIPAPQNLVLYPRAGGNIIVQCVYPTANTDQFPATSWLIWIDVVVPNPLNPPSYSVAVSGRILNTTIGPFAPGTYFVMVGLVRASDGALSSTIYSQVTIPQNPTEVTAVASGFQAIP